VVLNPHRTPGKHPIADGGSHDDDERRAKRADDGTGGNVGEGAPWENGNTDASYPAAESPTYAPSPSDAMYQPETPTDQDDMVESREYRADDVNDDNAKVRAHFAFFPVLLFLRLLFFFFSFFLFFFFSFFLFFFFFFFSFFVGLRMHVLLSALEFAPLCTFWKWGLATNIAL
jgi:hypothetical protein